MIIDNKTYRIRAGRLTIGKASKEEAFTFDIYQNRDCMQDSRTFDTNGSRNPNTIFANFRSLYKNPVARPYEGFSLDYSISSTPFDDIESIQKENGL